MNSNWKPLTNTEELEFLQTQSSSRPQLIFKHSTRCIISRMVFNRVDAEAGTLCEHIDIWYLDLLKHRDLSNAVAARFRVEHQSPQMIVISNSKVTYQASHEQIDVAAIQD